jgi:xylulokinase
MAALLGIDLGTSAVKAVVIDESARILGTGTREIPMEVPAPGRAEQDPSTWWSATVEAARAALQAAGGPEISAIGCDGHMHGFTLLDRQLVPVGRAITWADQRAADLIPELEARVGRDRFLRIAGTRPAAGFMAPSMAWLAQHEPVRLDVSAVALLPKDYLRLRLTGTVGTDVSDAAGTALFDVRRGDWSQELCEAVGVPMRLLPEVQGSAEAVGTLSSEPADELGIAPGIPVAGGSADQPAQAVANGLLDPGDGAIALGTGGQIQVITDRPLPDPEGRIHTFNHVVPERWYQLGATLSAGMSLRWLRDRLRLSGDDPYGSLDQLAAAVPPGSEGLVFLPYLVGERSPIMDPEATGAFVGLTLGHRRAHLTRAVLEGVAFSLRATRDAVVDAGGRCETWLAAGNGLASPLWRGIVADVFGEPLSYVDSPERTGVGAALLGGIAAGVYADFAEASAAARLPLVPTEPHPERTAVYDEAYARFVRLTTLLTQEARFQAEEARSWADPGGELRRPASTPSAPG